MTNRAIPVLPKPSAPATRPISFVCVHFSDDLYHNLLKSSCIYDPLNQLILVDNRDNVFFPNLSSALNSGMDQAQHELIALIHEDVFLVDGWQQKFEASLAELEAADPDWGMIGAVGSDHQNAVLGHWIDPNLPEPKNTFSDRNYTIVNRLDEQLMILRKSKGIRPDAELPSIHLIGRDLAHRLAQQQLTTYAINAPTVHKYADSKGNLITRRVGSPKIMARATPAFKAGYNVSETYLNHKLGLKPGPAPFTPDPQAKADQAAILDAPILLVGDDRSGARLVCYIAQDCGFFLGNTFNRLGDCMDMVLPVYRSVLRRHQCVDVWSPTAAHGDLRNSATAMLQEAGWPKNWGFKLAENAMILPDLLAAFPNARFVWLTRDSESTMLSQSHLAGKMDNEIGRACVVAAYDHFKRPREAILGDGPAEHMAITSRFQTVLLQAFFNDLPKERFLSLNAQEVLETPIAALTRFSEFFGLPIQTNHFDEPVDIHTKG